MPIAHYSADFRCRLLRFFCKVSRLEILRSGVSIAVHEVKGHATSIRGVEIGGRGQDGDCAPIGGGGMLWLVHSWVGR